MSSITKDSLFHNIFSIATDYDYNKIELQEPILKLILSVKPKLKDTFRCISYSPRRWQKIQDDVINPWKYVEQIVIKIELKKVITIIQNKIKKIQDDYFAKESFNSQDSLKCSQLHKLYQVIRNSRLLNKIINEFAEIVYVE